MHLLTLTRLGIGRFHLAEFDRYDLANFNRQVGATLSTLGLPKLEVMTGRARDVNPELELNVFAKGVDAANVDAFLDGVDVFVDGLDFFAFDTRELVFAACRARGIPAVTVAPLGMGAALLNFLPGGMSFADYFGFAKCPSSERPLRFLLGLAPAMLHRRYLADLSLRRSLESGRGPSTAMACHICAGIAATECAEAAVATRSVVAAPHGVHFDALSEQVDANLAALGLAQSVAA